MSYYYIIMSRGLFVNFYMRHSVNFGIDLLLINESDCSINRFFFKIVILGLNFFFIREVNFFNIFFEPCKHVGLYILKVKDSYSNRDLVFW